MTVWVLRVPERKGEFWFNWGVYSSHEKAEARAVALGYAEYEIEESVVDSE